MTPCDVTWCVSSAEPGNRFCIVHLLWPPVENETREEWARRARGRARRAHEKAIVGDAVRQGFITVRSISAELGYSRAATRRALRALVACGAVAKQAKGRATRYATITRDGAAPSASEGIHAEH